MRHRLRHYTLFIIHFSLALCALSAQSAPAPAPNATENLVRENFTFAAQQYTRLLDTLRATGAAASERCFPRTIDKDGKLVTTRDRDWTSGFFPGSLWYLYEYTGDTKWRDAARDYTNRLESIKDVTSTHDLGFMLFCSYGNALRLARADSDRAVLLKGAESLASRFNPFVGSIRSWDHGNWAFPVIIDNMMNLDLLFWASKESGNPRFREIAIRHALTTNANHFREDSSSFHVVAYEPDTGEVVIRQTHQGYANWSPWARGQAWGLYGFTIAYRETRNLLFLERAKKIAFFLLGHYRLPADKVPYWDFDAPNIPDAPRDASAAAIIASALIELSDYVDAATAKRYLDTARQQLLTLSTPAFRANVGENANFILMHSTGNLSGNIEIDVPLNYADYYFLEALLRYRAKTSGAPVVPPPPAQKK